MSDAADPLARIAVIRAALPPEGLFADKEWLLSPEPFVIDARLAEELRKLGYRLHLFVRACNELYQRSVSGKQPPWIADYLDRGKPPELVQFSRQKRLCNELPQVIRPDLVLTDGGFTIAELDNVPGGIGLTQWLNQTYAQFGTHDVLGGERGMIDGFRAVLGGTADIVVSDEAATYKPEMQFLARLADGAITVHDAVHYSFARDPERSEGSATTGAQSKDPVDDPLTLSVAERDPSTPLRSAQDDRAERVIYRFFENFDLANVP